MKNLNKFDKEEIKKAAKIINQSIAPLMLVGHGVLISKAQQEVKKVMEISGIPAASTLHGLSAVSPDHPLYVGMLGMHGNYSPNKLTNSTDLILAVGMRFDDRVTGKLSEYAPGAKVIHIDIDASEHQKNVPTTVSLIGDAKNVLQALIPHLKKNNHKKWVDQFKNLDDQEKQVLKKRKSENGGKIHMDQVVALLSKKTKGQAVIVSDVGQNQMFAARYYDFRVANGYITSGGLGTMGFAVPAAIGVKIGVPEKMVIAITGDGGFQMTIQELGTIMQEKLPVKILLLNNEYLGMVRQWQQLFFEKRYSFTKLNNPDFIAISKAYKISAEKIEKIELLDQALDKFIKNKGPCLLEVKVVKEDNIFPMVPTGASVADVRLK